MTKLVRCIADGGSRLFTKDVCYQIVEEKNLLITVLDNFDYQRAFTTDNMRFVVDHIRIDRYLELPVYARFEFAEQEDA